MKKIALASALMATFGAGIGAVHGYWWLRELMFDADRIREIDNAFEDMTDIFFMEEVDDVEYQEPDED
jgi:hypothetical protein